MLAARIKQTPTAISDPQVSQTYNLHAPLNEWCVFRVDIAAWNIRNVSGSSSSLR